jgi:hypothetical protein
MRATPGCVPILLLILTAPLAAQQQPQRGCADAVHRQFDFWLGDWEVRGAQDKVLGHNRISGILEGCALLEEWTGAAGGVGTSLNAYDATSRKWRQTWIDNSGGRLDLVGGLEGGRMVLTGEGRGANGGTVHHRVSFEPSAAGVRQLWEQSTDGGTTWSVSFDGMYRKTHVGS